MISLYHKVQGYNLTKNAVLVISILVSLVIESNAQTVLMFVSHEGTYYSEYIVMKEALEASGYSVDVRSANAQDFSIYMIPMGTDIEATANTLSGSSYAQFQQQFASLFGSAWNESLNTTPSSLPVMGSILDVENISSYEGLIIVGGTGALAYRVDGDYSSQGSADRLISAEVVQSVAEKLNDLAIESLLSGKPVIAQCHGASIPVFWRIPGTSGAGVETLGISLLKDGEATGYPEAETSPTLMDFGVTHRTNDRVTVSSPNSALNDNGYGDYKIMTTRDWYPQTVAHAARTFLNIIETHPSKESQAVEVSILVVHGGALNESNCIYTNRSNDIPCNHGGGGDLPADYEDLMTILEAEDAFDDFSFTPSQIDITGTLSFDKNNLSSSLTYLEQFDVVLFYKHWSTGLTDEFLQAIYNYADNGGGVMSLHHGLYNDIEGAQNKDVLISLFGAQSSTSGWSENLTNYNMHSTNYGHFISTLGVDYDAAEVTPAAWGSYGLPTAGNSAYSYLPIISIYDEIYTNTAFEPGIVFGRGINEITPLFSNDLTPSIQSHTAAFTRLVDFDENDQVGRLFYTQVGERTENYSSSSQYYRMVRNAVVWAGGKEGTPTTAWNGSAWNNGDPDDSKNVEISENYTGEGFSCVNLEVDAVLTISSGSLIVAGDVTIEGDIVIESGASMITYDGQNFNGTATIHRNTRYSDGRYSFVGSPVNQNTGTTASSLGQHVYRYDESQSSNEDDLLRWIEVGENDELVPARGYTQANQQLITFEGVPNTGTINYSGFYVNDGWHLVSNPYAGAISIDDFLDGNLNTTGAVYIWDDNGSSTGRGSSSDYIVANKIGATDISGIDNDSRFNSYIGSAQGFFVQLDGVAGDITFTEVMRRPGNNSDDNFFRKAGSQTPILRVNLINSNGLINQTIVGWNDAASDNEIVSGYDAPVFNINSDYAVYTQKAERNLTIQAVTNNTEEIPVGFNVADAGNYSFSFKTENLSTHSLYLLDRETGQSVAISLEPYSFYTTPGHITGRFVLKTKSRLISLDNEKSSFYIFNKTLHIENPKHYLVKYQIWNLSGHSMLSFETKGTAQVDLSTLRGGLYLVSDGVEVRKVHLK